jgi:hypothetical protein
MLRRVALVRTDVSEESYTLIIKVTKISELGTALTVTSNRRTLRMDDGGATSSEALVLTRVTQRKIPDDGILHSHRRENLKSYTEISISDLCAVCPSVSVPSVYSSARPCVRRTMCPVFLSVRGFLLIC